MLNLSLSGHGPYENGRRPQSAVGPSTLCRCGKLTQLPSSLPCQPSAVLAGIKAWPGSGVACGSRGATASLDADCARRSAGWQVGTKEWSLAVEQRNRPFRLSVAFAEFCIRDRIRSLQCTTFGRLCAGRPFACWASLCGARRDAARPRATLVFAACSFVHFTTFTIFQRE